MVGKLTGESNSPRAGDARAEAGTDRDGAIETEKVVKMLAVSGISSRLPQISAKVPDDMRRNERFVIHREFLPLQLN
jgi:hypothetical protein